jgi:hypothetical protein
MAARILWLTAIGVSERHDPGCKVLFNLQMLKKYWLYVELTWRMVDEFFYLIPRRASAFVIK